MSNHSSKAAREKAPHNEAFGFALARLRGARQLTQERLSELANVDRTFISLLERGLRSPTLDTIHALCAGLDISLVNFFKTMEEMARER